MSGALLTIEVPNSSNVKFFDEPFSTARAVYGRQFALEVTPNFATQSYFLEVQTAGVLFLINSLCLAEETPDAIPLEWRQHRDFTGYKRTTLTLFERPRRAGVIVMVDKNEQSCVYDRKWFHDISQFVYDFPEGQIS